MSVKSGVSNNRLRDLMEEHGEKPVERERRVLITGAQRTGSIGEEIVQGLMQAGHIVQEYVGDVREAHMAESGVEQKYVTNRYNTLIMCHGVSHLDWMEDCPPDKVKEIMDVNLTGSMLVAQQFVHHTSDDPYRKAIIMIGSMAYKAVLNGSAAYCASKAGLAMLSRCLAWELAPKGYDVFCIHPSNTLDTPMSEETIQGLQRYLHLSRLQAEAYWNDSQIRAISLTRQEIWSTIKHLLSGDANYLAGAQLELAGGQR